MKFTTGATILATMFMVATPWAAQAADKADENRPRVRPNGLELETGVVIPENADAAALIGGRLHLGNLFRNWLHFSGGVTHWKSDLDAEKVPAGLGGTVSDTRIFGALQFDVFTIANLRPYANVGFAEHLVSASIPGNPELEDLISGSLGAPEVGFGITMTTGALEFGVEARREYADDVKNWTFGVGLGTHWAGPRKAARNKKSEARVSEARVIVEPPAAPAATSGGTAAISGSPPPVAVAVDPGVQDLRQENEDLRRRLEDVERRQQASELEAAHARADSLARVNADLTKELEAALAGAATASAAANKGRPAFGLTSADETLLLTFRDSVLFPSGQAVLAPGAADQIERVGAILEAYPGAVLLIEGHSDSRGDAETNLALSQERASAVRDVLVAGGFDTARIRTAGLGDTRPIADNGTESGRALNRRVEIRISPGSPS